MLINRKTDYALRCLLLLAKRRETGWLAVEELSRRIKVSRVFLAKIVQILVRAGLAESSRGKRGGVRLKNRQATLLDVIRATEPNFSLNKCFQQGHHCLFKRTCALHKLLKVLGQELAEKLKKVTIVELARQEGSF